LGPMCLVLKESVEFKLIADINIYIFGVQN
jgi:hypothetical protein